ncbi:hypothetical protein RISK_004627 [Rhodopirellula islandica]|uniref:Uncharacterized protein n=1 Tax=Rhodopirellula islandica TaxID=595434 RepID=A0A0J1B906_RHOIS|nr:hypothetical protein RISK_004627 [Rhodopirellula islandica]
MNVFLLNQSFIMNEHRGSNSRPVPLLGGPVLDAPVRTVDSTVTRPAVIA